MEPIHKCEGKEMKELVFCNNVLWSYYLLLIGVISTKDLGKGCLFQKDVHGQLTG